MVSFLGNTGLSRRLHRVAGRWMLEHQVFVPLGQGVFRPTLQKVQGESAILQSVQDAEALRQMTARLMQDYGAVDTGDVSFESVNGGAWRPYAAPAAEVERPAAATSTRPSPAASPVPEALPSPDVSALEAQLVELAAKVETAASHAELTSLRDALTEIVASRDAAPGLDAPVLAELEALREKLDGGLERLKDVATQPEVVELKDILCEVAERQERFAKQIRDLQNRLDAVAGPPPGQADATELSPEESEAMNAIASALGEGSSLLGVDG